MTTMSIRVSEADKRAAAEVAEYYGFDLSSVTRAFWKQMVRERRIPLNLGNYDPNDESLESLQEAKEIFASGKTRFKNSDELIASLKA